MDPAAQPVLSVVAPMYNEAGGVQAFVAEVAQVLADASVSFEIVLVDDGSTDRTWEQIVAASADPRVRGVALARNFGHQSAIFAGMCEARGEAVVTMDGDLQHPPALLPRLLELWRQGHQVVNTQRADATGTSWFKRTSSRWFYRVFSYLAGVSLQAGSSDFRLLDASVVAALRGMNDVDLFIRGQVAWMGFKTAVVPYQAGARFAGATKFSLRKMLRFAVGAVLSFSLVPLRLGIWVGFVTSLLALAELGYIVVQYLRGHTVPGWASMMTWMSLMFGVLFVLLGIIGIYLGKIYDVLKARPRYLVGERTGTPSSEIPRS
jgi:polyisoprenyl-phosphate glycosyltransferase